MYRIQEMRTVVLILLLVISDLGSAQDSSVDATFPPELPVARLTVEQANQALVPESLEVRRVDSESGLWRCQFTYRPPRSARSVHLAGDFNGWSRTATPMTLTGNGSYRVTVELPEGTRHYKFVVDGESWRPDPLNPRGIHDGHGGSNSVLGLGPVSQSRSCTGPAVPGASPVSRVPVPDPGPGSWVPVLGPGPRGPWARAQGPHRAHGGPRGSGAP